MINKFPAFLSVIINIRNEAAQIRQILLELIETVAPIVADYELVIIDNASSDDTVAVLAALTAVGGLPNLQVYALAKAVDTDTVAWVGLEHALGDFALIIDPMHDDIAIVPTMLDVAIKGANIVFATNELKSKQTLVYRTFRTVFNTTYQVLNGVHLTRDGSQYRLISKRVINFVLQHPLPAVTYRRLPAVAGFSKKRVFYKSKPRMKRRRRLLDSMNQSVRLLVSTRGPMRFVTALNCGAALVGLMLSTVAAGNALKRKRYSGLLSLSLQQSGMFLVSSLVQLTIGEYVAQTASAASEGLPYRVAEEFTSAVITRHNKLNVEVANATFDDVGVAHV